MKIASFPAVMARAVAAGLTAVAMTFASSAGAASPSAPVVQTQQGEVQGALEHGAYAFLGLHYGADTGVANRFLAPQPAARFDGVLVADHMGNQCPQPPMYKFVRPPVVITFSDLPVSEDCLVLNVWTRHPKAPAKKPVMVWIHGGAFAFGSASDKYYDGTNLARTQDVVVVSLNHRLNVFGYMPLGPEAGSKYATSADNGMLDIVQALQWVKANIAQFGGDPDNVTIFGQSGGGGKVTVLLAMPAAKGLFQKAIIESGADIHVEPAQSYIAGRDKVLAALGLKPEDALKLKDVPMDTLIAASMKVGIMSFAASVDGNVLPTQPFDPSAPQVSSDVPVMVGTANNEGTDVLVSDPSWPTTDEAGLAQRAALFVGADRAKAMVDHYRARAPQDPPSEVLASILTDQMFTEKSIALAERKSAQHAAPVYAYRIDWKTPVLNGVLRSPHGVELPFVFDDVSVAPELDGPDGPSQERMAAMMSAMWAQFARTGNPNLKRYPRWPAYDAAHRATFIFDDPPHVVSDPDGATRTFWGSPPPAPQIKLH